MTTTIYALCDPATSEIRYIGKTNGPANNRLSEHMSDSNRRNTRCHCHCWIRSLNPGKPKLIELEIVVDDWVEAEQFWIAYFKSLGARLTNLTAGGEGATGYVMTEEHKAKLKITSTINNHMRGKEPWNKGRTGVYSEETKGKISQANRNRSPEVRAKLSESNRRRTLSEETRSKISVKSRAFHARVKEITENVPQLRIPVLADAGYGQTWWDAH